MTFLIGTMVGAVVGIGTMCFMFVVSEEDKWLEKKAKEADRCPFCGGRFYQIREYNGRKYRYCFGCFHEYEVDNDA